MEENKLGQVYLKLRNTRTGETEMTAGFDAVIVATGYVRNVHETLLKSAKSLIKGDSCTVGRDYRVKFREGTVAEDSGVWLQGCCESSHGVGVTLSPLITPKTNLTPNKKLSDTLLSILAVRGGEIVDSIFGKETEVKSQHASVIEKSVKKYASAMVRDILNGMRINDKHMEHLA